LEYYTQSIDNLSLIFAAFVAGVFSTSQEAEAVAWPQLNGQYLASKLCHQDGNALIILARPESADFACLL
jgi:hypothetical protein